MSLPLTNSQCCYLVWKPLYITNWNHIFFLDSHPTKNNVLYAFFSSFQLLEIIFFLYS